MDDELTNSIRKKLKPVSKGLTDWTSRAKTNAKYEDKFWTVNLMSFSFSNGTITTKKTIQIPMQKDIKLISFKFIEEQIYDFD